jgi:hypothetical protein
LVYGRDDDVGTGSRSLSPVEKLAANIAGRRLESDSVVCSLPENPTLPKTHTFQATKDTVVSSNCSREEVRSGFLLGLCGVPICQRTVRNIEGRTHQGNTQIYVRVTARFAHGDFDLTECLKNRGVILASQERRVNFLDDERVQEVLR